MAGVFVSNDANMPRIKFTCRSNSFQIGLIPNTGNSVDNSYDEVT